MLDVHVAVGLPLTYDQHAGLSEVGIQLNRIGDDGGRDIGYSKSQPMHSLEW